MVLTRARPWLESLGYEAQFLLSFHARLNPGEMERTSETKESEERPLSLSTPTENPITAVLLTAG